MESNARARFAEALDSFRRSDYSAAIRIWQGLEEEGFDDPNLGLYLHAARSERLRVMTHLSAAGDELASGPARGEAVVSGRDLAQQARLHLAARRLDEGIQALQEAWRIEPEDAAVGVALARAYLAAGRVQDALALAGRLAGEHPAFPAAHLAHAHVLMEMDRHPAAQDAISRARAIVGDSPEVLLADARLAHARLQLVRAATLARAALDLAGQGGAARSLLEDIEARMAANERRIAECRRTLETNPGWADWHFKLGELLAENGRLQEALDSLDRALAINPSYGRCLFVRGRVCAGLGRLAEALDDLRGCVATVPGTVAAEGILRATELEAAGMLEEAAVEYSEAVTLEPDYASQHIELGKRFYEAGLLEQAKRELQTGTAIREDYADGHYTLALVERRLGDAAGAIAALKAAVASAPGFVDAMLALAEALAETGQAEAARGVLGQVRVRPLSGEQTTRLDALAARAGDGAPGAVGG